MSEHETFGDRLRYLRKLREWKLDTLAIGAGISVSYLSQLERGEKADPSARILQRLAIELGVSMERLLGAEAAR